MVVSRCRFLAPVLAFLIGAPALAAEPAAGDAVAVSAQDQAERAAVDALLARAEAQGLPALAGGTLLDGTIERTRQSGDSRMTSREQQVALRDAAGRVWIGAAEPLPDEPGMSATWQPRAPGAAVSVAFPAPYFAPITVARLAQTGNGPAWSVLASFAVRPTDAQPTLFPVGPDTAGLHDFLHADEAVTLSRTDALAHALVLWGLRRLCDLPLDRLAGMEAFIVATAPPRLAAWAAHEAAERRRARTSPEPVAPFAVGADGGASPTVGDAQLVEALADTRAWLMPAQGFDGIAMIGSRMTVADIASSALARRWRLVPEVYAHRPFVVWYTHLGPSMAPEPDAPAFIAALRERVLDRPGPLADRLGAALAGASTGDLLAVLPDLDPQAIHYDPLAPSGSLLLDNGSASSLGEAADQVPMADLRQALARNLAPIWTRARPALTTQQLSLAVRCLGAEPAMEPVLDAWPWTPADDATHAAYDELHGRSERTDALVLAGLKAERLAPPLRDDPLLLWRPRPTAARVGIMQRLLADPATSDARCLWLTAVISSHRPRGQKVLPADLALLLVALLLADERPIPSEPAAAVARALATDPDAEARTGQTFTPFSAGLPAGTRVCDLALHQARWWLGSTLRTPEVAAAIGWGDAVYDLRMSLERRETVRLIVRRALVPVVRRAAEQLAWSAPAEVFALPAEPPLLSVDEEAALRAVLAEAVGLGFPDLAGSTVRSGALPGQDADLRVHVRLADGHWLVGGDGLPAAATAELTEAALPQPASEQVYGPSGDLARRLSTLASRLPRIGPWRMALLWQRDDAWPQLAILARWAAAPRSAPLDAALLAVLCVHAENPQVWPPGICDLDFGLSPSNPPPVGGTVAELLRERLSRWFLDRAIAAGDHRDAPGARHFADAALAILPPADHAYWAGPVARAAGRAAIPATEAPTAELARRLAAWQPAQRQQFGGPRVADDDGALVALLGDLSPVRTDRGGLPLTVGQVALFTLADRWHGDPRWLVGRPDDSLGTDEAVRADAQALQEWWRGHGADGEAARAAALMAGASPAGLASREVYGGFPRTASPAIGAALTARFAGGMPSDNAPVRPNLALPALLWFAPAIGTTGWPDDAMHRQVRRLLALASGDAGAAAALLAASELPDPDPQGGPNAWQPAGILQPQRNLGLIVYQPTKEHRALLRTARNADLAQPVAGLLAALAGGNRYPVLGDHGPSHAWRVRSPTSAALAIDLAAEALGDLRPIPASLRGSLKPWSRNTTDYELPDPAACPDLRVCDWAMARTLLRPQDLDVQPPPGMPGAAAYLAAPLAERDGLLPAMRGELAAAAKAAAQAAGVDAAPPSGF